MRFDYRLVVELLRADGEGIGHAAVQPDWGPAIEWTRLTGLRTLGVWAPESAAERAIEPLWHATLGEPYMRAFRVHLASRDAAVWHEDFPVAHFAGLARLAAARLMEQGALDATERFLYRVLAYRQPGDETGVEPMAFVAVDQPPPLVLRDVRHETLLELSGPMGDTREGDFDVFLPAAVLAEASALTERAGDVETGGVLIGHLGHAGGHDDIVVEITALVAARHTVGASKKLTFTSDTWTDVRAAVELRRRHEVLLGWFHSHPQLAWCREKGCPVEQQRQCQAADGFFSTDDLALHRTVFPQAFTVALVMTHSIKGIIPRLFGWRTGSFEPRGFRVIAAPVATGDTTHAAPLVV